MKKSVNEIVSGSKEMIKTLILSCHGMLECGIDYKGTMTQICRSCEVTDDENHHLNECINFSQTFIIKLLRENKNMDFYLIHV